MKSPISWPLAALPILALALASSCRAPEPAGPEPAADPPSITRVEGVVSPGQVLGAILAGAGLPEREARRVIDAFGEVFDARRIRPGDRWSLALDEGGEFRFFEFRNDPVISYRVETDTETGAFRARRLERETEEVVLSARGTIENSLYRDMTALGAPPALVMQFAEIFASKIDFLTEPRRGDEFLVTWEAHRVEGRTVRHGRVLTATYRTATREFPAFFFECPAGRRGYFDEEGNSLESAFLRAPLEYSRISSHFTHRRLHPVHRVYRPHLGIDYAAPTGTPVSAIGAGRVSFVGWRTDGFGNTIIIDHPNGYNSYYGHLSSFARGLRAGQRVSRGQFIGRVGATGTATGPHLDFRIRERSSGRFINFLALELPPSFKLEEADRELFEARRGELEALARAARGQSGEGIAITGGEAEGTEVAPEGGGDVGPESWWRRLRGRAGG